MKTITLSLLLLTIFSLQAQEFTLLDRPSDLNGGEVATGDLNGDGQEDFVIGRFTRRLYVGIRDGLETMEYEIINEGLSLTEITIYDFDNDGDNDIIASELQEELMILFENDGNANFVRVDLVYPAANTINISDINNDGSDEIILSHAGLLEIFTIDATNPTSLAVIPADDFSGRIKHIEILDNNGDGLDDIIGVFNSEGLKAYHQTANLEFAVEEIFKQTFGNEIFYPTFLNDDDIYDFIVYNGYQSSLILSEASGEYEELVVEAADDRITFLVVDDFNQDGKDEIVIAEGEFPYFVNLMNFEDDSLSRVLITDQYTGANTGGTLDLNGDGLLDLYFFTREGFETKIVYAIQGTIGFSDDDGDGFTSEVDCDDSNPDIYPGAEELCDDLDNDCDGTTDEDLLFLSWWIDGDGDGYGVGPMEDRIVDCKQPVGYVQNYDDCDDENILAYPGAPEILDNGIDEDCDGKDDSVATHELENVTINIFPNPASNYVKLTQSNGSLNLKVSIIDFTGKILLSQSRKKDIDISSLVNGSYLIKVEDTRSGNYVIESLIVLK